jgi:hypothetical protein
VERWYCATDLSDMQFSSFVDSYLPCQPTTLMGPVREMPAANGHLPECYSIGLSLSTSGVLLLHWKRHFSKLGRPKYHVLALYGEAGQGYYTRLLRYM